MAGHADRLGTMQKSMTESFVRGTEEVMGPDSTRTEVAEIYAPNQRDEILLAESAQTLAVRTLFKMCYRIEMEEIEQSNAHNMSENGYVPFIRTKKIYKKRNRRGRVVETPVGGTILSSFDDVCTFLRRRQDVINTSENLSELRRQQDFKNALWLPPKDTIMNAEMELFLPLCQNFTLIELFLNWKHEPTFNKITISRYTHKKPWPLSAMVLRRQRNKVLAYLSAKGYGNKNLNDIEDEFKHLLEVFSNLLEKHEGEYIFGRWPSPLDALLFGHIYSLYTTPLLNNKFQECIHEKSNLVKFLQLIENTFFLEDIQHRV